MWEKKCKTVFFFLADFVVLGTIISQMVTGRLNTRLLIRGVNSFTCLEEHFALWRTKNIQTECFKTNKRKQNKSLVYAKTILEVITIYCCNSTTLELYRNDFYRNSLYRNVYYRFTGVCNNPCWTLVLFLSIKSIES